MKALILAAGKGTRLAELTAEIPKPMVPVDGEPLLAYLVKWLRSYGITDIAMNLHHCPQVIESYFGNGSAHDVAITYSFEPSLMGTAGAAKQLAGFLDEPFVLVYGDVYTNLNLSRLIEVHCRQRDQSNGNVVGTLSLYHVANPSQCGLVDLDETGRIVRFVEKPPPEEAFTDLANAGILVLEPAVLDLVPAETVYDFGRDLFPRLLNAGLSLCGLPLAEDEFLVDIGTPAGLARAQILAEEPGPPIGRYGRS